MKLQAGQSSGNLFIDSLPRHVAERIVPSLTITSLQHGQVLARPNEPANALYFPLKSVISTISEMTNGDAVEVGLAGFDGFSGLSFAFGNATGLQTTVVQIPNSALSLESGIFQDTFDAEPEFRSRVLAYAHYIFSAASQFAACNRLHPIEERLARWLLMAQDRVRTPTFALLTSL